MGFIRTSMRAFTALITLAAVVLNLYIYNYDLTDRSNCSWPDKKAKLRLLAFGDPQIRGIGPWTPFRNKIDIHGNDFYLGHVYRVMTSRLNPTHVAVMGDLLSNQWIPDDEFFRRVERYKSRIFRHSKEPPVMLNISGNHDIGYGGEMTPERINRYEQAFGKVNFVITYKDWRLVVLNSLALDGNGIVPTYHENTIDFLNAVKDQEFKGPSVLLTHVPLAKQSGICKDGPQFIYYEGGGIYEQNHLSADSSTLVLNSVFEKGNPYGGIILTGHDHEGCESVYQWEYEQWTCQRYYPGEIYHNFVKESTVRSMMGEYGGNTGILSGSQHSNGTWTFEYRLCRFAVQHIWWVTHVVMLISLIAVSITYLSVGLRD